MSTRERGQGRDAREEDTRKKMRGRGEDEGTEGVEECKGVESK
jgi:hypothetical protein